MNRLNVFIKFAAHKIINFKISNMNNYETVFIMNPVLSEDQIKETVNKFVSFIKTHKGTVNHEENWGLKKLKYTIQKEKNWILLSIRFCI